MDIRKKLLLYGFINKKFKLIHIILKKKFNINIDIKIINKFFTFYNKDFNALLNYKTNEKINNYKCFLFKLLKSKSDKIIDSLFLIVMLYLIFIMKLLEFNKKINKTLIKQYCHNKELYLENLNCISKLELKDINYKKFIECNYKVTLNNLHIVKN